MGEDDARASAAIIGAKVRAIGRIRSLPQTGDEIEIDVAARKIHLHVADDEISRRREAWTPPPPRYARGYGAMYSAHIGQADEGCDFDFLQGCEPTPEPEIH